MEFNQILIRNCYVTTIKEVKKFITNGHLIMNRSFSLEKYIETHLKGVDGKGVSYISDDTNLLLQNIIDEACEYIKNYTPDFVKKVIYLKSLGYSITEISKKLNVGRYFVDEVIHSIEKMVKNGN